jgi:hypothetical protein
MPRFATPRSDHRVAGIARVSVCVGVVVPIVHARVLSAERMEQERPKPGGHRHRAPEASGTRRVVGAEEVIEERAQGREVRVRAIAIVVAVVEPGRRDEVRPRTFRHVHVRVHEDRVEAEQEEHERVRAEREPEEHERHVLHERHERDLERVLSKRREPVQRLGAVVHVVEAREEGRSVCEAVVAVAHQLEDHETEHHLERPREVGMRLVERRHERALPREGREGREHDAEEREEHAAREELTQCREREVRRERASDLRTLGQHALERRERQAHEQRERDCVRDDVPHQ